MSFFSSLLGGKKEESVAAQAPASPIDEVKRQIESAEAELHEAEAQRAAATNDEIKNSFDLVVARKTQALRDLEEKLRTLSK